MSDIKALVEARFAEWKLKADDPEVALGLEKMEHDEQLKTDSFYRELSFGTGGLRGTLGAGTNCLNVYTIKKATQGVADYMKAHGFTRAALSCDSRINSEKFKVVAAEVLAANGIACVITEGIMPVPFLSFLTRESGADTGIMITASHNPKQYNGYKVYGSDGCQITDDAAAEIIGFIAKADGFTAKCGEAAEFIKSGMITYADERLTERFIENVLSCTVDDCAGLIVTYSPLNGAGYKLVPEVLKRMGAKKIDIVPEQGEPDGNFTTCPYPNPEKPEALALGLKLAEKTQSDILIATDPDCDRLGCAVLSGGKYTLLTGNEVGALLADYLLSRRGENDTLPKSPLIVKTIVTTLLADRIAQKHGAELVSVLTGFKYIGEVIGRLEKKSEANRFILGFEESYGYSSGAYVRDKDGVNAAAQVAAMTAYYKRQGKTLCDKLNELYAEFGTYKHKLVSYEFPGASGNEKMRTLLASLRKNGLESFGGLRVLNTVDYLTQTKFDLPKADVLSYDLEGGAQLIVRPSGTEPLIKNYLTVCKTPEENEKLLEQMTEGLNALFA